MEGLDAGRDPPPSPGPWFFPYAGDLIAVVHPSENSFWDGFEALRLNGTDGSVAWRTSLQGEETPFGLSVQDAALDEARGEALVVGSRYNESNVMRPFMVRLNVSTGNVIEEFAIPMPEGAILGEVYVGALAPDGVALVLGALIWMPPLAGEATFAAVVDVDRHEVRAWHWLSNEQRLRDSSWSWGEPPSTFVDGEYADQSFVVLVYNHLQREPQASAKLVSLNIHRADWWSEEWLEQEHVVIERGLRIHREAAGLAAGPEEGQFFLWSDASVQSVTCRSLTPPPSVGLVWPVCNVGRSVYAEVFDSGLYRQSGYLMLPPDGVAGEILLPFDYRPHAAVPGAAPGELLVVMGGGPEGALLAHLDTQEETCEGVARLPHASPYLDMSLRYDAGTGIALTGGVAGRAAPHHVHMGAYDIASKTILASTLVEAAKPLDNPYTVPWTDPLLVVNGTALAAHASILEGSWNIVGRVDAVRLDRAEAAAPAVLTCLEVPSGP